MGQRIFRGNTASTSSHELALEWTGCGGTHWPQPLQKRGQCKQSGHDTGPTHHPCEATGNRTTRVENSARSLAQTAPNHWTAMGFGHDRE